MEAASRAAFELDLWLTEAKDTGAIKTTEHWVEAAFEAGYNVGMTVAAEPHSEDDLPITWFRGEPGNYRECRHWDKGAFPVYARTTPKVAMGTLTDRLRRRAKAKADPTLYLEAANEIDRLRGQLINIGNIAHDASTGPAVPDVLWEVRRIAYEEA